MLKKIAVLFLFAALVFSQAENAPEVAEKVVEKVVDALKEEIVDVAIVEETEEVAQEEATTVTIHDLTPENKKNLDKLIQYQAKAVLLEGQTDPKSVKELGKTQRKMITLQNALEEAGVDVEQAISDWNEYKAELEKRDEQKALFKFFEQQADEAWLAEHPKEYESFEIFGVDKIKAKIEKLKKKIQKEEFKLAFVEERLANPEKYMSGTYIFRFAPAATEESIETLYALLAEKSIEVLHKYSIGQTFRGFSAEISDCNLGSILDNENIVSFEADGPATLFAQGSNKYVEIIAELDDSTCTGSVCAGNTIDE